MSNFAIDVKRVEVRNLVIEVSAADIAAAQDLAIDAAADRDFRSEGSQVSVHYEAGQPERADDALATIEKKYMDDGGNHCPVCGSGSEDLESGQIESDGLLAWRSIDCKACDASWDEQFQLTGISKAQGFDPHAPATS